MHPRTRCHGPSLALAFALALVVAASLPAAQVAGYGRDGTRIYPDCTPPTKWTEKDVAWEAPLPWATGSPIVVGGKLLAMCEPAPGWDFPLLVCLDAATGKELWRREVDHLAATGLPPPEQERVRATWHAWLEDFYGRQRMRHRYLSATDEAAKEALRKEAKTRNWEIRKTRGGLVPSTDPRFGADMFKCMRGLKELKPIAGLVANVSQHGTSTPNAVGLAYGTPVSDGSAVYVHTAFGSVASYDLDGKLRWMAWAPRPGGCEGCNAGRSPIVWQARSGGPTLVLSDIMDGLVALDAATGEIRWKAEVKHHSIVTPMVMTVGGTDILLAAGVRAFRLPDGKELKVEGYKEAGMQTLVKHDEPDVVFFCGSGEHCGWSGKGAGPPGSPAAVRFAPEGDTLKATVLWHAGTVAKASGISYVKSFYGGNAPWMLYDDGKFYHRAGFILDSLTGKVLVAGSLNLERGKIAPRKRAVPGAVPRTRHLLCLAGGHVYGLTRARGKKGESLRHAECDVFTADGKFIATNPVPRMPPSPEQQEMFIAVAGRAEGSGFSVGNTFTFAGSRIYFRSYTSIVCIGK